MRKLSYRPRNLIGRFVRDRRANAAIEFAFIVPLMMTMFFGMVEFGSAIASSRKVTLSARNLSDLVSQSSTVTDLDIGNFNETGKAIMTPYWTADYLTRVSEIYVDPATLIGKVKWSKGSGTGMPDRAIDSSVTVPTALRIAGSYLIYSEVNHKYVPAVGYVMGAAGVPLSDTTYTRPRQSTCVLYPQNNAAFTSC
jgi:Flp pilus assembly protein TadG